MIKMSFCNKKQRDINLMLMYIMTLDESSEFEKFLEKVIQFGWLGTSISSSSLFFKLGSKHMKDHDNSWMKMISKEICISKIVLIMKLFL